MKGHIRERSPGHWAIVIELRDPATGKRRRKWHKFAGTKRKAQDECARLISELNGGLYIEPAKITVGQFLDRWLEHVKPLVSPRTHERYGELVTKNIKPLLGAVLLTKLRPMQISDAYAKALSSGHRKGKGGLAPSTVRYMHVILKASMRQAVRWQILARNPVDAVDPPKIERAAMTYLRSRADRRPDRCHARHADDDDRHPRRSLRLAPRRDRGPALAQRQSRRGPTRGDRERRTDQGGRSLQEAQEREGAHGGAVGARGERATQPLASSKPKSF